MPLASVAQTQPTLSTVALAQSSLTSVTLVKQ
jgi:hypothetical protein